MLTDDGLLEQRTHPSGIGGVQRIYRWGSGGLSLVNSPKLHHFSFAWEAAVLSFDSGGDWCLTYETPLSSDVEVFRTDDEANAFIAKAKEHFTQGA